MGDSQGGTKREAAPAAPWSERIRARMESSVWTPLGGKAVAFVAGFFALALIGSGRALDLLPIVAPERGTAVGAMAALAVAPLGEGAVLRGLAAGADAGAVPDAAAAPLAPAESADAGSDAGDARETTGDGKVVLNLATEDDLRKLPGIGPTRARAILAMRARLGRFRRVEDLLRVKGIGRRSLARLRPLVVLDPP